MEIFGNSPDEMAFMLYAMECEGDLDDPFAEPEPAEDDEEYIRSCL